MLPLSTVATLVAFFVDHWGLSNAEAGWLAGSINVGYMLAVPFLMALTDRIDARLVFIAGAALSAVAALAFALLAEGLWSGTLWRILAGMGLAGCYMPGLKALTDRLTGAEPSRGVASYTASYAVGAGFSYLFAGLVTDWLGWRGMFAASAIGPLLPLVIGLLVLRPKPPAPSQGGLASLLDFRPVLRNRPAMGYVLAYGAHCYELAAFRAWIVAFMGFALAGREAGGMASITLLVTVLALLGLPASVFGNEASIRFGRRRVINLVMSASALIGCFVGFTAGAHVALVLALAILYAISVTADSGSITAGVVAAADPKLRGATMALHSTLGFAVSFVSPLVFGLVLDLSGGQGDTRAWALAFAANALFALGGPLALRWAAR
ncbi:MAG: MFS transporter [Alphaproteobacteria bacterium]|nr:MFS transporter [Alphaproteobacteria bacterium]